MKRTKSIPEYEINPISQELALEAFGSESFLSINKKLLSHFGPNLTVYIGNLIDKMKYFSKKEMLEEDGSFYLFQADQAAQTGMSEYQLRKCKNKLKSMGILQTQRRGIPPKEHYILDMETLVQEFLINKPLVFKGLKVKKLKVTPYIYKEIKKKENIYFSEEEEKDIPSNGKKLSAKERNKLFLPLAIQLSEIICTQKNMKHTSNQLNSWTVDIRKLIEGNGISQERVETALDWYKENIGGEYVPVIESGSSLRNKFIKLEAAIERINEKKPPRSSRGLQAAFHNPGKEDYLRA